MNLCWARVPKTENSPSFDFFSNTQDDDHDDYEKSNQIKSSFKVLRGFSIETFFVGALIDQIWSWTYARGRIQRLSVGGSQWRKQIQLCAKLLNWSTCDLEFILLYLNISTVFGTAQTRQMQSNNRKFAKKKTLQNSRILFLCRSLSQARQLRSSMLLLSMERKKLFLENSSVLDSTEILSRSSTIRLIHSLFRLVSFLHCITLTNVRWTTQLVLPRFWCSDIRKVKKSRRISTEFSVSILPRMRIWGVRNIHVNLFTSNPPVFDKLNKY